MTKRTFFKTVRRAVSKNFGRFLAIIAIVALGVGFLTGLLAATPDMKKTVDSYFDGANMADLEVRTSVPLSVTDVDKIRSAEGVEGVMTAFSVDALITWGSESLASRVYMYEFTSGGVNDINRLELLSGRMPVSEDECLIERGGTYFADIGVGQTLEYNGKKLTVSGVVGNPWYFSNQRETSRVGSGTLKTAVYINQEPLGGMVTDVFVTVKGAQTADTFSEHYNSIVSLASNNVQTALIGLPEGSLFVLTRDFNLGYKTFEAAADKVAAVAVVFPAFFFLVAALVSLTSMTRMVEDERSQIGTLKAMGYGAGTILLKYVIYALIAGAIGCAVGVLAGFQLLPALIWNAYKFMFHLPTLQVHFNFVIALISCLAALVAILGATIFACLRTLREKPAQLLQPRSPKPGGRILLERIKPVWNHMKFKDKSTVRNLFRYKKHFIMTVIGVGGCTALMLTALGLSNSTDAIVTKQYSELLHYDLTVNVASDLLDETGANNSELNKFLADNNLVTAYMPFYGETGYVAENGERVSASMVMPQSDSQLKDFVTLRQNKKQVAFNPSSVVLTQKATETLKIKVGDTFTYESQSGKKIVLTLTGIAENYVGSSLYVGSQVTGSANKSNALFAISPVDESKYDGVLTRLLEIPGVTGAQFTAQERATYESLIGSIGYLVIVLVLSAGALAVIVLYNLININIIERSKELATLKVLGYRPAEIAGYILREIVIMTVVGVLVGLLMGIPLHFFVAVTADTVELVFGKTIAWWSYLVAAAATLAFSAIVDLIMCVKLKKINMAESMKAPE